MQSRIEILKRTQDITDELYNCAALLSEIHPTFEKFTTKAIFVINSHLDEMQMIREIYEHELDSNIEPTFEFVGEACNDAINVIADTLELAGTLMEYTIRLKNEMAA